MAFERCADTATSTLVCLVRQRFHACGSQRVDQAHGAGSGQVVYGAGQRGRGPDQPASRVGQDLDVDAVAFVLPGVVRLLVIDPVDGIEGTEEDPGMLDEFAFERQATSYKNWPGRGQWYQKLLGYLSDESNVRIHFNLDGIDDPAESAEAGRAVDPTGYEGLTNWELHQIEQRPSVWKRIIWYRGGQIVRNPFL